MYMAPEIIAKKVTYKKSSDMWSVGIVTFILLTNVFPFPYKEALGEVKRDEILTKAVLAGDFMTNNIENRCSKDARDFVYNLLQVDETKRNSAEEALDHPWIRQFK